MSGIFLILLGLSLTTFPGINIDWKQGPQWQLGQEYLYRGTVRNTGQSEDIQLLEQYSLEVRLLVTQVRGSTAELVCATKLVQTNSTSREVMPSTHLTFLHADARGHITSSSAPTGKNITIDGPATFENGFLLPLPEEPLVVGQSWEAPEPGRLPRKLVWTSIAEEKPVDVVTSVQESIDWQRPRGDSVAWRRTDNLHFHATSALPVRIDRVIERRPPGYRQVMFKIFTEYQLVSMETLRGPMLEERLADLAQLRMLQNEVITLSQALHDRRTQRSWQKLATRLKQYEALSGKTPYRDALLTLRQTVQDGLDNRLSPVKYEMAEQAIEVGQLVPPFNLMTLQGETLSSSDLRGQPAVLLFLQPGSNLTKRLAEELPLKLKKLDSSRYKVCLLLSKTGSLPSIPPGCLTAYGQPLLGTFHVQVTPYVVLLDSDGTLLLSKEGWGPEIEQELFKLMKQELAKLR